MPSILDRIAEHKRQEVETLKHARSAQSLLSGEQPPLRDFTAALCAHDPAIIAEIKRASPVKGILCEDFDVKRIATTYARHGASCLSVLTDVHFFKGDNAFLQEARACCTLPALRKDFIVDAWQLDESRSLGADCILLIAAILDDFQLADFCAHATELGMAVLVESHTPEEFDRALRLPTPLIGVNNRDLHTFDISLERTIDLASRLPAGKLIICESGIHTRSDIELLQSHDVHAFLIGESLMRAKDPGLHLRALCGHPVPE